MTNAFTRAVKKLHIVAIIVSITIGALIGLALTLIGTGPGSRWLAGEVVRRAGPAVPFELRIGTIQRHGFNTWTISRIEGREPTSNRLFLYARQITVTLKYQPLLSGRFEITRAHVDSLFLTAWLDSLDRLHPRLTPREADSLAAVQPDRPFPLSIQDLSVDGLALGFDDDRRGLHTRLESGGVGGAGGGRDWAGRIGGRFVQQSPWIRDSISGELKIVLGLTPESVNIDTLSWQLPGFHVDARGGWYFRDSEARFTAGGHAAIDSLNLNIPGIHSPRGRLDWTAEVKAGARPPSGRFTFDLNSVTADSLPPALAGGVLSGGGEFNGALVPSDSLSGNAHFSVTGLHSIGGIDRIDGTARLDHGALDLNVNGPGVRLTARGAVLDSTGPDIDFELALAEISRFLPKGTRISGPLTGRGHLDGPWAAPAVTADIESPDLNLFGHHEKNVTGAVAFLDTTATFSLESASGSRLIVRAAAAPADSGRKDWSGTLEATVPRIRLSDFRAVFPDSVQPMVPGGIAEAHAKLEGRLKQPRGFIDVTSGPLKIYGVSADTAFVHALVEPERVHVTGTLLKTGDTAGRVDLDLVIPLDESGAVPVIHPARDLTARATFSGIKLETADLDSVWQKRLNPWTRGSNLTLTAEGEASLATRPGTSRLSAWSMSLKQLSLTTERARLSAAEPIVASGSGQRLEIQPFHLDLAVKAVTDSLFPSGADSTNRIEGHIGSDDRGNLTGEIVGRPMTVTDAAALFPGLPELTGSVTFRVRPEGNARSLDQVILYADLDWVKPGNRRVSLDRIAARLHGGRDGWSLDNLYIASAGDSIFGSGSITKPAGGPAILDFTLVARDFHLESVPFTAAEVPLLRGRLNADARLTGTTADPNLTGYVEIDSGSVQTSMMAAPVENMRARLRMDGAVIHVDTLEVGSSLLASGDVTLKGRTPPELDLRVVVNNFDLKSLPLPPGSIRVYEGNLIGMARVTGTTKTPRLEGKLNLEKGALQAGPMLVPVRDVTARMRLNGTTIVIDTLRTSGKDGAGDFSGRIDLASPRNPEFNLDGSVRELALSVDPGIQARLTGPVTFNGSLAASRLTAELRVSEGRYAEEFDIRRFLARRRTFVVQSAQSRSLLDAIVLDMRLHTRSADDFKVDNNLATIPMSLDLRVSGTAFDWRVAGTAEADAEGGKVYYLDREFEVNHLSVVFDNPRYPDPSLDLSAETTMSTDESYDITLNITGRASNTRTILTSVPALSQPDIVALLTLGVPVSGLAGGSGSGNATSVFLNRAGELTTATVFSLAAQRAAALTGLSRVQFRPGTEGEGTRVTLGKDLGKRVSVDATTSLVDPTVPRLEVNWRLSRRFSIRSIGDQAAESSLDFRYVLRFP